MLVAQDSGFPSWGTEGQDPGNGRLSKQARACAWASGLSQTHGPAQGRVPLEAEEQEASAWPVPDSEDVPAEFDVMTGDDGRYLQGCPADFRRPKRFRRAFSSQYSRAFCPNQSRLGRMLMRIGWCWIALWTTLLPVAEGPFSLGACHGHQENAPRQGPPGGLGVGERS